MSVNRRKRRAETPGTDLTPMIDVTFQLLIFFILCTRFVSQEDNFQVRLPHEGTSSLLSVPTESLTIYCIWDQAARANSYVLGNTGRGRKPVMQSYARLSELVILRSDTAADEAQKKYRYRLVFDHLVEAIESYMARSGADFRTVEISFAVDPVAGARRGTAPWVFVSLAMDATARVNGKRKLAGRKPLDVRFRFTDALGGSEE